MRCLILLATYNGEKHLDEQLASCANQSAGQIDVLVSDDNSTDRTPELLKDWQARWDRGEFKVISGPRSGFAENFRHLMLNSADGYDCYAFCDQDDKWHPDKLAIAIEALMSSGDQAAVYCGRTRLTDEAGNYDGHSPVMMRPPSFENALFQSLAGGNTMVLNAAAIALLREVSHDCHFVSHDWWTYIWVTGVGGRVIYDTNAKVDYRQHSGNLIGKNSGPRARLRRFAMLLTNQYSNWITLNFESIGQHIDMLSPENRRLVESLIAARKRSGLRFAKELSKARVYRQSKVGTLSLYAGAFLGRV
ncbi:MAG: glycosyltransferase [Pseudomonadota bacterium]